MDKILKIEGTAVLIGTEDQKLYRVPISSLNYMDPRIGDEVEVFYGEEEAVVNYIGPRAVELRQGFRNDSEDQEPAQEDQGYYERSAGTEEYDDPWHTEAADDYEYYDERLPGVGIRLYNKHLYTWLFAVVLGELGVDRFLRGQIGLGILKLVSGGGFGIWWLVDSIIAIYKAYGGSYMNQEDFTFINGNYSK